MKRVSINYAIAVGTIWVNIPVIPLMFTPICFWILLLAPNPDHPATPKELGVLLALFVLGFVIAWSWWSYAVPRWRIWAYGRVDDIAALKTRAVQVGLTWPDGYVFERTECKPKDQVKRARELDR